LSATDRTVWLRGGLCVPEAAYRYALDLEARGVHLAGDGPDILVGPRDRLTDADRFTLRALKPHLRLLADYQAPEVM
jgi:hypothetical protein